MDIRNHLFDKKIIYPIHQRRQRLLLVNNSLRMTTGGNKFVDNDLWLSYRWWQKLTQGKLSKIWLHLVIYLKIFNVLRDMVWKSFDWRFALPARKKDVPGVLKHVGQQPYNFSSANVESDLDVYMYTNTYIKIRVCVVMFEVWNCIRLWRRMQRQPPSHTVDGGFGEHCKRRWRY